MKLPSFRKRGELASTNRRLIASGEGIFQMKCVGNGSGFVLRQIRQAFERLFGETTFWTVTYIFNKWNLNVNNVNEAVNNNRKTQFNKKK